MFTSILAEEESEDGAEKKTEKKTVEVRIIEAEIVKFN